MVRRLRPRPATFLGATDMAFDTVLGWLSLRSFYGRPAYAWNECMGTYVSGLQAQAKTAIAVANEAVVVSQQRALGAVLRREVYGCCPDDSIERLGRDGTLCVMLRISTETPPRRFDRRGNWRGIRSPVTSASAAASRQRCADRNGDQKKDPRRAAPTEGYPVTRDTRAIQRFFSFAAMARDFHPHVIRPATATSRIAPVTAPRAYFFASVLQPAISST